MSSEYEVVTLPVIEESEDLVDEINNVTGAKLSDGFKMLQKTEFEDSFCYN